ncbi:MAG: hypothetical protein IT374_14145 [Polyangiaceae bacterium]|nr:hypothetical protein [Polyangiaceae bacterium]
MTTRILVGTRKGTFLVERHDGRWRPRLAGHAGMGVNYVARDPFTGKLWALLGHGHWGAKLSVSDDGGATWADNPAQVKYPEGARYIGQDMYEDATSDFGVGWRIATRPATLQKLWVAGFGPGGAVYIGTIPGGLFQSRDGGATFELNRPLWNHESRGGDLFAGDGIGETKWFGTPASEGGEFAPGIHSIAVDPRDPGRLLLAASTAGVIATDDGGQRWRAANRGMLLDHTPEPDAEWGHDTHFIEQCQAEPDHVWQQNHAGVYASSDCARTWRKVSRPAEGVHFGFPITVDPAMGRRAWVVPGRSDQQRMAIDGALFVARTDDGGESWTHLRRGLPQECAHDVVLRHALTNGGGVVAFGSTTGNLYVSEDHGERWETVANNLPPIYSVRLG